MARFSARTGSTLPELGARGSLAGSPKPAFGGLYMYVCVFTFRSKLVSTLLLHILVLGYLERPFVIPLTVAFNK